MGYRDLVEWGITQIGIHNDADGSNKYNEWYYGRRVVAPWCATMWAYGFYVNGIYSRLDGLSNKAGCVPWMRWAKEKGIWSTRPKVGSMVLFDWNPSQGDGADHIGIVEKIFDGGVITIEGNTSNYSQSNGGYVMRKTRYNSDILGYIHVDTTIPQPKPKPVMGFTRIAGKNRYETSKKTIGETDNITLVSGSTFADALSATYFAKQNHAPILLTSEAVKDDTIRFIHDKGIKTVYIIGGSGAVPEIEKELSCNVIRLAGKDRYKTNLEVLRACETSNAQIIIVSGRNFPDGLCAGMIDRPVMMVNKTLSSDQIEFLKERKLTRFYVFGGEGVVPPKVIDQLKPLGEVSRYSGDNRYATSRAVDGLFFPKAKTVIIASGKSFPDGLCASNLGEFPLVLADDSFTLEARRYISTLPLEKVIVVGGTGSITDNAVNWCLTKY